MLAMKILSSGKSTVTHGSNVVDHVKDDNKITCVMMWFDSVIFSNAAAKSVEFVNADAFDLIRYLDCFPTLDKTSKVPLSNPLIAVVAFRYVFKLSIHCRFKDSPKSSWKISSAQRIPSLQPNSSTLPSRQTNKVVFMRTKENDTPIMQRTETRSISPPPLQRCSPLSSATGVRPSHPVITKANLDPILLITARFPSTFNPPVQCELPSAVLPLPQSCSSHHLHPAHSSLCSARDSTTRCRPPHTPSLSRRLSSP